MYIKMAINVRNFKKGNFFFNHTPLSCIPADTIIQRVKKKSRKKFLKKNSEYPIFLYIYT